jgi:hypothetical protein
MQEVRDLATVLNEAIAFVKKAHSDAKTGLMAEVQRAQANVDKVKSLVQGLKDANVEVEAFLSGAGTNFPPTEALATNVEPHKPKTDINGVTLNPEGNK